MLSFNSYGEWTKVNEDVDGDSYYIDFETVKEIDGYVVWWEMRDLSESNEDGDMSTQIFIKGDCESSRNTFLSIVSYKKPMGNGEGETFGGGVVNLEDIMGWRYPPPGTVAISNLKIVCSLADQSSMNNYQSKVLELIAEYESYEWGDDDSSYSSSSNSIPPNAYAYGDSWKCNSGYERHNNGCRKEVIKNQTSILQSAWIGNIAAEVKSVWNFPGAEDGWFVQVLVTQDREGNVLNVKSGDNNVGNSVIAKRFIDSVERAVYKSSPLPIAPDASVWQKDILFTFYP
jgi:hypothetical protein